MTHESPRRWSLLLPLGTLLIVASQLRWGVDLLAWFAPVPFLLYLRFTRGALSRLLFAAALITGWSLAVAKIITDPLPLIFALFYGVPIALLQVPVYLSIEPLRRRLGERAGLLTFPLGMVLAEFVSHAATPLGSWGAAAYTQLGSPALLQLTSLFGIAGLGFLVYWAASLMASTLATRQVPGQHALVFAGVLASTLIFGSLRLAVAGEGGETVTVAAVGTDATFGGLPWPTAEALDEIDAGLMQRTRAAARAGASLVAWTEAATLALPEDEAALIQRVQALAREEQVQVVAAYVVPVSTEPFRFENKYVWVRADGSVDHRYLKHHPVPGEPAIPGVAPLPLVESGLGRASGAICYDYDFPTLGARHAGTDLDLVVVPSSDWRGIDPIHTRMAAVRAIEGGYALLRPTRFGLSAGVDPYGRVRGEQSAFDAGESVLLVRLPRRGITTLYARAPFLFPFLCVLAVLWVAGRELLRWTAVRRGLASGPSPMGRDQNPVST